MGAVQWGWVKLSLTGAVERVASRGAWVHGKFKESELLLSPRSLSIICKLSDRGDATRTTGDWTH